MKRVFLLIAIVLFFALPAHAQQVLSISPAGTTSAVIDQNGWHNFQVTLVRNIVAFQFQGIPTPAQGQISVIFTQDAVGGRSVTFVPWVGPTGQIISVLNPCVISQTANATTLCQFNFNGVTSTWIGLTAPGAPIVSQVSVPFSSTPTFTYSPGSFWTYFSITLTGNVTASTLSGGQQNSQVCFFITQDAVGNHTFTYPSNVLNPPPISASANATTTSCYINVDGTNWQNLSFAASSTAVAGNQGDVQIKNGSGLGSGSLNDNGAGTVTDNGVLLQKQNLFACGTNPWFDIVCFGARNAGIVTTTATNTDSTHVTVSVASYVNGDGFVAQAGGATVAPATPAAPTLTSGESESGTQSTAPMTTGLAGSTAYSYRIFGVTPNRGVTAASPVVSTSTGPATLGQQSITLTNATLLGSVESFTTSAAHGLQTNAVIHLTAGSNSNPLSGWFPITADTATTGHVADVVGNWSTAGISTSSGHFVYFIGNQLLWSAVAGIDYYGVCASRPADAGAYHIIGFVFPAIPGYATTAEVFDDFGSVISANPPTPWFLSDANCTAASSTPELYSGVVQAGGGTVNLTVSPPLQNNITGVTAHQDNEPAILAAATAAAGLTFVNIPNIGAASWQLWFPLNLPAGVNVVQAGNILNADYIHQIPFGTGGSGSIWQGGFNLGSIGCPAFGTICGPKITGSGPVVFWNDGSSLQSVQIFYQPNAIGLFSDIDCHGNACLYDKVNAVVTGTSANDKWGMPVVSRGGEFQMKNGLISSGENQVIDESWTPAFFLTDYNNGVQQAVGEITLRGMHGNRRGLLWIQNGGTAIQLHVDHYRRQGGITPLFWIQNTTGNVTATIDVAHPFGDTESQAKIAIIGTNGANILGPVTLTMTSPSGSDGGGDPPDITGGVGNTQPSLYMGVFDSGGVNPTGWALSNGAANINIPIVVPGSSNSGNSTIAGSETVAGTSQMGLLSPGNSTQLISSGSANPSAVLWNVAHASIGSVTSPTSFITAGHALTVGIFVGTVSSSITGISDTLGTSFAAEGSQSLSGAGGGTMFWYFGCVPSGGNDAVTATSPGSPMNLAIWDTLGVNCSAPLDVAKFSLATTATPSVATITTANANELVLAYVQTGTGITAQPGAGYTLDHSGTVTSGSIEMQHQEFPASSSTTTAPMTLSASSGAAEAAIALVGQIPQLGTPLDPWLNLFVTNSYLGGKLVSTSTAPTISSGFGTSPSILSSNGTATFTVNVGTGGTATSGVIGLPTATTGWVCNAQDQTTPGLNATKQTANTTTSSTLSNFNTTTGAAAAWTASDTLIVQCTAF